MFSENRFLRTPHLGWQDGWTALALATGGKRSGAELLCLLLEISWGAAVRVQRTGGQGEVLLFTLPPVGRMYSREASSLED